MAEIVMSIDLRATFRKMEPGDKVTIPLGIVTAENVRNAATRFSRENRHVKLKVSAPQGSTNVTVVCQPKTGAGASRNNSPLKKYMYE